MISLVIDTVPTGASITIDGLKRGISPLNLWIEAGSRRIELQLDGYVAHSEELILLKGSKTATKVIKLTPNQMKGMTEILNTPALPMKQQANHTMAYSLIGTGVALVSVGVGLFISAANEIDEINQSASQAELEQKNSNSSFRLKESLGWTSGLIGSALIGFGGFKLQF